ncbi:MAG TPA: SAM-dependent methyltransferase [Candidatus Aminicenantes bacterium]|nr:SAM-dependent methyltransferase [Candidatus Aminicenantes bacterium]
MKEFLLNTVLAKLQLRAPLTALRSFKVLEHDYGHFRSARKWQSVDRHNNPIPWLTYPAIDYLNTLDLSECRIFEYGAGNSTLYWEKVAKSVVSIESNPKWFKKISRQLTSGEIYLQEDLEQYPDEILERGTLDIVLIDGAVRPECVKQAVKKTKSLIILDNSQEFPESREFLRSQGFKEIVFTGFSPIVNFISITSFFIGDFIPKFKKD